MEKTVKKAAVKATASAKAKSKKQNEPKEISKFKKSLKEKKEKKYKLTKAVLENHVQQEGNKSGIIPSKKTTQKKKVL